MIVFTQCFVILMVKIPVFRGAAKPILGNAIDAGNFHGKDGLGDVPDPNAPGLDWIKQESAVSAISRIINENPREVRGLLCVC